MADDKGKADDQGNVEEVLTEDVLMEVLSGSHPTIISKIAEVVITTQCKMLYCNLSTISLLSRTKMTSTMSSLPLGSSLD